SGLSLPSRVTVVSVGERAVPLQCRQCADAPCVAICPTRACHRHDNTTVIDESRCIACKLCLMACPFGVISLQTISEQNSSPPRMVAQKCDLCVEWRAQQNSTSTACIEACPTRAIRWLNLVQQCQQRQQASATALLQSHKESHHGD
ncbi:MAG: 4Fe-4S dicluster domain-containing protein, partial [Enterobacteriaceae bacterium]